MVVSGKGLSATMNAKVIGTGNDFVILAHGYGGDQSIWDKIVPCLSEKHRVLVFDWNFSGFHQKVNEKFFDAVKYYSSLDSFADDLVDLMDEMELRSCVFVGHSMSAMVGCIASIKRPELFKKLILVGASPRYLNAEDYEGGFELPAIEQFLSAIESNFHSWASAFAPLAVGGKDLKAAQQFETTLKKMNAEVALSLAKTIFLGDRRATIEEVAAPCTIITTTNDIVAPTSVAYYMQKKMEGKPKVEIIDTDGHFPQVTAPEQLLDALGRAMEMKDGGVHFPLSTTHEQVAQEQQQLVEAGSLGS
ncbi:hypothetical protein Ancab_006962 [Ancistrocladus abbreviatus]